MLSGSVATAIAIVVVALTSYVIGLLHGYDQYVLLFFAAAIVVFLLAQCYFCVRVIPLPVVLDVYVENDNTIVVHPTQRQTLSLLP